MRQRVTFSHGLYVLHGNFKKIERPPLAARTPYQRKILIHLLNGASVHRDGRKFRVRDKKLKPLHRLSASGFLRIRRYLKAQGTVFVIDWAKVNQARPNTWVKQYLLTVNNPSHERSVPVNRNI